MIYGSSQTNKNYANYRGSQTYAPKSMPQTSSYNLPYIGTKYTAPKPQVLGASTGGGGGGNAGNSGGNSGGGVPGVGDINQQTEDYSALIDQAYNDQMAQFATQEQGVSGSATLANQTAEQGMKGAQTAYEQDAATKETAQQTNISTAQKQGATATQQARDLFKQTQQSNIAQLSGLGISSSSVAEAMAETLGVETARRIAGVTGSVQEVVQNATAEVGKIKGYLSTKIAQLTDELKIKKDEISLWARQQVDTINNARNQAATAKAQQRLELFSNAQNLVANLTSQYQTYQAQLQQWAQQKTATITPFTNSQNVIQAFNDNMNTLQNQYSPTEYNISGTLGQSTTGKYSSSFNVKNKTTEDDETNPFN